MKNWPLPNLKKLNIRFDYRRDFDNWFYDEKQSYKDNLKADRPYQIELDLPKGWCNPWPDLPNPDEDLREFRFDRVSLSKQNYRCEGKSLLGYYLSWHIVGVSFENENGRAPYDGEELLEYNNSLPVENQFGIHICCDSISEYIKKFDTTGLEGNQIPSYLEYCTYLTLMYVIAHEWGHYRSEVLSFQLNNFVQAVCGSTNSNFETSYLSYFAFKKENPDSNFEEVFCEWASLKMGIFNYHMQKPKFAKNIHNWSQVESTVKHMLTKAISRSTRIKPYSDIRFWVDFESLSGDAILKRISANKPSTNRSVNDNVKIMEIRGFKKGKMIDLLMHNQMQFSESHNFNGFIKSWPVNYPKNPNSLFYNFGDDECSSTNSGSNSDLFLRLNKIKTNNVDHIYIKNVIKNLADNNIDLAYLPIRFFPNILPLNPVYFH